MNRIDQARRYPGELAAYFELHIEQGPTLHQRQIPLGVVTGITGRYVFNLEVQGKANHAGTTPMADRQDALAAAAHLVLATQRLAGGPDSMEICRVATVGNMQVRPNAVNVVPGEVSLGVEFRDVDANALAAAEATLRRNRREIADANRVSVAVNPVEASRAVPLPGPDAGFCRRGCGTVGPGPRRPAQRAPARRPGHRRHHRGRHGLCPQRGGYQPLPQRVHRPPDCANGAQALLNLLLLADARLN